MSTNSTYTTGNISTLSILESKIQGWKQTGADSYMGICPCHAGKPANRLSLSVTVEPDRILIKCFAGCDVKDIVKFCNLKMADLFLIHDKQGSQNSAKPTIDKIYSYTDEQGNELSQAIRMVPKSFYQRHMVDGKPVNKMDGVRRVLYHLPEVKACTGVLFHVEGEKDVETLRAAGLKATTSAQGAGNWKPEYADQYNPLCHLILIPDKDAPGFNYSMQVYESVKDKVSKVGVIILPGDSKDVTDWAESEKWDKFIEAGALINPSSLEAMEQPIDILKVIAPIATEAERLKKELNKFAGVAAEPLPPADQKVEEQLIGSIINGGNIAKIDKLQHIDFYFEPTAMVFDAIKDLIRNKTDVTLTTVTNELDRTEKLERIGGDAYLNKLISQLDSTDIESLVKLVYRMSVNRQIIALAKAIKAVGFQDGLKEQDSIIKVTELTQEFRKKAQPDIEIITPRMAADAIVDLVHKYDNATRTANYGFNALDSITGGLQPGEFIIFGARPGIGKTEIALNIAEKADKQRKKILVASAEMVFSQLLERIAARELNTTVLRIRKGNFDDHQIDKLIALSARTAEHSNLYYVANSVTSQVIYNLAARMQEQYGLDLVVVDYLQKLGDCYDSRENQNIRVSRACKVLVDTAHTLNIPVICLSQLSRAIELRGEDDRNPNLSDLRDSGSIEQDADVVFLLNRYMGDAPTRDNTDTDPSILGIKMAKNRQLGPASCQFLKWNDVTRSYADLPNPNEPPIEEKIELPF